MPDSRPAPGWPDWVEQWVLPYLREPVLLPVLIALLGHVVVGLSPLMLAVWRTGNPAAIAALALLSAASVGLSLFEARSQRRPGAVTLTIAGTWLASVGVAVLAERTGVF